jgi:uncharacterized membrane protein YvbJ
MRFNEVITKFRNNHRLQPLRLYGGEDTDISIFKDYLAEKGKRSKRYTLVYVTVLIVLILISILSVVLKDKLSDSFKYVFAGEGGSVLVLVGLLYRVVKIEQNSMDLLFLLNYFKDKPEEQKKVLDAMIDDIKNRSK